jgi:hypothetical protein
MSTLCTIVKDYDKNIVLRDCQRQAFEYLHDMKGNLLVTTFGTTFETFTEIESLQILFHNSKHPEKITFPPGKT